MPALVDLEVLVVDCQSSGATPVLGDLLELGWGVTTATREIVAPTAVWTRPGERRISPQVKKLIGWDDAALAASVDPLAAWQAMLAAGSKATPMPVVIHYASFELPFLRDLHARSMADDAFPLDVLCVHKVAARLLPDLPRRNMRALAGYLGHSPSLLRRASGHVEATAFVWRALVPKLAERGVLDWEDLRAWIEAAPASRGSARGRGFPLAVEKRRALPDEPGIYRFLRANGDVLYVGKAASLKKRVASHFTAGSRPLPSRERSLEMLSQAHEVSVTTAATPLEAALLEVDAIKALDPPYNVQLRLADRQAWFASADWSETSTTFDAAHPVGPLPSERALSGLAAIRRLLLGAEPTDTRRAAAVGVPPFFTPDLDLFRTAWSTFVADELSGAPPVRTRLLHAGARIVLTEREEREGREEREDDAPHAWDLPTIRRYLERTLVTESLLVRRSRLLLLLSHATVHYREPKSSSARLLTIQNGLITAVPAPAPAPAPAPPPSRTTRCRSFTAPLYDRLRVLSTELLRLTTQGGTFEIRIGHHTLRPVIRMQTPPARRRVPQ